jgi:hypothetical protein
LKTERVRTRRNHPAAGNLMFPGSNIIFIHS